MYGAEKFMTRVQQECHAQLHNNIPKRLSIASIDSLSEMHLIVRSRGHVHNIHAIDLVVLKIWKLVDVG